jgi:hypothetical protein
MNVSVPSPSNGERSSTELEGLAYVEPGKAAARFGPMTEMLPLDKLADAVQRDVREVMWP